MTNCEKELDKAQTENDEFTKKKKHLLQQNFGMVITLVYTSQ